MKLFRAARRPQKRGALLPAIYLVASAAVAGTLLWGRPLECAYGLGLAATGIPFYLWFARRRDRLAPGPEVE